MASTYQRCRPLLRVPAHAVRGASRSPRPRDQRPFSATAAARVDKGKKKDDPIDTTDVTPRNDNWSDSPLGTFNTGYFKPKGRLGGLPRFVRDNFELNAKVEGEEEEEAAAEEEEEEDEDELEDAEGDIRVLEEGDISAENRALAARMRRQGRDVPSGRDTPRRQPRYERDPQSGEYLDEEGLPQLERGDAWVDRRLRVSESMIQEIERFGDSENEEAPEPGFFSMEEEKDEPMEDPEWEHDDITSMGHLELEQQRELREFYRTIAWDMPLLYNHRKDFKPPTSAQALRFRYSTYLGETHPASRKVVMDFTPSAVPDLTAQQSIKLIKLLGVRYNPSKDRAKMSCEMFPTAAQNKRWLGDTLDKLLAEARDAKDTFEDVPFDFRHHKPKPRHEFPEEWKMTGERRAYLDGKRQAAEAKRVEALLPGGGVHQLPLPQSDADKVEVPVMAGREADVSLSRFP